MGETSNTFNTNAGVGFATSNDLLSEAVQNGDLDGVKRAVEAGAGVNGAKAFQFRQACAAGHIEIARFLHEKGADPLQQKGRALADAAGKGQTAVVKWLLETGLDPNADEKRAFRQALTGQHIDTVRALVKGGLTIKDDVDDLLMLASDTQKDNLALLFLEFGAKPDVLPAARQEYYANLLEKQVIAREKERNAAIRFKIRGKMAKKLKN